MTSGAARDGRKELVEDRGGTLAQAGAGAQRAEEKVGAGDADHIDVVAECLGGIEHLWQDGAHTDQRHCEARNSRGGGIAAGQDELARRPSSPPASAWSIGRVDRRK